MLEGYKVLVTVGTTAFDSMIEYLDVNFDFNNAIFQIGPGTYFPTKHPFIKFQRNLENDYVNFDIIITHAGAGTVYACLERKKKLIVVPNLERVDSHQLELAIFLRKYNYALIVEEFRDFGKSFDEIMDFAPSTYIRDPFVGASIIADLIKRELK